MSSSQSSIILRYIHISIYWISICIAIGAISGCQDPNTQTGIKQNYSAGQVELSGETYTQITGQRNTGTTHSNNQNIVTAIGGLLQSTYSDICSIDTQSKTNTTIIKCGLLGNKIYTSGSVYEYIYHPESNNDIVLDHNFTQEGFEILNQASYHTSGKNIILKYDTQGLVILQLKENIYIQDLYIKKDDVIIIKKGDRAPKYQQINIYANISGNYKTSYIGSIYPVFDGVISHTVVPALYNSLRFELMGYTGGSSKMLSVSLMQGDTQIYLKHKIVEDHIIIDIDHLQPYTQYQLDIDTLENGKTRNYDINFKTFGKFVLVEQKDYDNSHPKGSGYINNKHYCFSQPIDIDEFTKLITQAIGSGKVAIAYSQDNDNYTDIKGSNYCAMFYYYLNPNKEYIYNITGIQSLFGEKTNITIKIPKTTISDSQKYASIAGNMINILASQGVGVDTIQLGYKNMSDIDLYIATCDIANSGQFLKKIYDYNKNKYNENNIIASVLNCNKYHKHPITISGFDYRKPYIKNINISKYIGNKNRIFATKLSNTGNAKYFLQTNIGSIVKSTEGQIHIWNHSLDTGLPYKGLDYELHARQGKKYIYQTGTIADNYIYIQNNLTGIDYGYIILTKYDHNQYIEKKITGDIITNIGISNKTGLNTGINSQNSLSGSETPKQIQYSYKTIREYEIQDQTIIGLSDNMINYFSTGSDGVYISNTMQLDQYQLGCQDCYYRGYDSPWRIFGYTDRVLYKPGDEVHIAGRIRKAGSKMLPSQDLQISVTYISDGSSIYDKTISKYDIFGGYTYDFKLPKNTKLGTYNISMSYTDKSGYIAYFNQYIKVEEFKKKSFKVAEKIDNKGIYLDSNYYFGKKLNEYDLDISYSYKGQNYGYYDWRRCNKNKNRCDQPIYYSRIWGTDISSGGYMSITSIRDNKIFIPMMSSFSQIGDIDIDIKVKDKLTQEVVYKNISQNNNPKYIVGIYGRDYDYISVGDTIHLSGQVMEFDQDRGDFISNYKKLKGKSKIKYILYHHNYDSSETKGPDGEYYYADANYKMLYSGYVDVTDGSYSLDIPKTTGGAYFIRWIYDDIYECQKTINVYDRGGYNRYNGSINNNWKLTMYTADKTYKPGDILDINIEPYISGAQAIITIEKDNKILLNKQISLGSKKISIPVESSRYPNAIVSVVQIAGENINKNISKNRQSEPRFWIGYQNINLDPDYMKIKYKINITDLSGHKLEYYQPGQKVKLNISTTDPNDNPIQTRLSVSIVDQALTDIYDELKKPLENFYTVHSTWFGLISNYINIYKSLKVFSADGTKGGAGGTNILVNPRKKFVDTAYRSGNIVTDNNGQANIYINMPDNLTKWVVDIVGISQDLHLGSDRAYFVTSQDVILQPNLPQYITYQDHIQIPISIISNTGVQYTLSGIYTIGIHQYPLVIKSGYIDLDLSQIPREQVKNIPKLNITISAYNPKSNHIYDSRSQDIILRHDTVIQSEYYTYFDQKYDKKIKLPKYTGDANININISPIPTQIFEDSFAKLLHYPYGCTEQTLSSLYPILIAKDVYDKGLFGASNIISGDKYKDNRSNQYRDISTSIKDAMTKIYAAQYPDGSMGYRPYSENLGGGSNVGLSIYTYSVISTIKSQGYTIEDDFYNKLVSYLNKTTGDDYIYYQLIRATNGQSINNKLLLEKSDGNDISTARAIITLLYSPNAIDSKLISKLETILSQNSINNQYYYGHSIYDNPEILKTYIIGGLINQGKTDKLYSYISELIQKKSPDGRRYNSTQHTVQSLSALSEYIAYIYPKYHSGDSSSGYTKNIQYKLTVNNQSYKDTLNISGKNYNINLSGTQNIDISYESDMPLVISSRINYVTLELQDSNTGVSLLDIYTHSGNKQKSLQSEDLDNIGIGDILDIRGAYTLSTGASQVAIVISIPSNFTIINPLQGQSECIYGRCGYYDNYYNNAFIKFTNIDGKTRYNCQPRYYEVQYDKLFAYYDEVQSDLGCQVDIQIMKTHNGKTYPQYINIRDMYGSKISGKKYIK